MLAWLHQTHPLTSAATVYENSEMSKHKVKVYEVNCEER